MKKALVASHPLRSEAQEGFRRILRHMVTGESDLLPWGEAAIILSLPELATDIGVLAEDINGVIAHWARCSPIGLIQHLALHLPLVPLWVLLRRLRERDPQYQV